MCTLYCARELCDRPYDVSIIGIYKRQLTLRDGSILSGNSWDSDETLRNEILNLCRQHDGKAGQEPWYIDPLANQVHCHPSIRHPAPVRLRPQLRVNTNPGSEYGEITSGTTVSPDDSWPRTSPGAQTLASDFYPISRTSTVMTSQTACESRTLLSEFSVPKVPAIPGQYTKHKRAKSSLSSLRRFLPKSFPMSLPLSSDPQIRALADPNAASDVEKQVVTPSILEKPSISTNDISSTREESNATSSPATQTTPTDRGGSASTKPDGHNRTMTMNSADAPEVVVQPEPAKVRRSQTACFAPSIHHPHHPNFVPGPINPRKYSLSCRQNSANIPLHIEPVRRSSSRQAKVSQAPVRSASYQFDQSNSIPRHTQSQYHPNYYAQSSRWASQHAFDTSRMTPPMPRRSDVEVIYPSTRRPRSNTHGGLSGPLSCILESTSTPRASVNETQLAAITAKPPRNVIDPLTYRGANRTSLGFY